MRILLAMLFYAVFAICAYATTAQEYMDWGYDKFRHGDYAESIKDFNNAIAQDPNYAEAYAQRGFAKQLLKDNTGALDDLNKASQLDKSNATYKTSYQNLKQQFDKYNTDIKVANNLLNVSDQNTSAYLQRGVAKEFVGDYNAAIADYKKITEISPNDWFAYTKLADTEYALAKYDDAIKHYSQVITIKTANRQDATDEYYKMGLAKKQLKQYKEAIADFDQIQTSSLTEKILMANFQRGLIYYELQDYQKALTYFSSVSKNEWIKAKFYIGKCYYQLYLKTKDAIQTTNGKAYVEAAIKDYPSFKEGHNLTGLTYISFNWYDMAISEFDIAIKLDPDYKEAIKNRETALIYTIPYTTYVSNGNKYMGEQTYMKAVSEYNKAIMVNSSIPNLYVLRGNAAANYGDYEKAVADYNQAITMQPNYDEAANNKANLSTTINKSADSYVESGNKAYNTKDFQTSINEYGKAVFINPSVTSYRSRGDAKFAFGDYEGALSDYNKANELNPNYDIFYNRARAKAALGDYQGAIDDYDRSIQKDAKFAAAYENRGIAKYNLGNYKDALTDLDKAISMNANRYSAYYNRANVKKALNSFKGAIADYSKALELNAPNQASIYNVRGMAKYISGDTTGAIEDYDKATELDPNYAEAYYNLGICYKLLKEYDEAITNFDHTLALNSDYENAFYNRAIVKGLQKKYDEAIADYTSVIGLNPKYALAYRDRGAIKELTQDYRGAISDWEKAVELNPSLSDKLQSRINKAKENM